MYLLNKCKFEDPALSCANAIRWESLVSFSKQLYLLWKINVTVAYNL